MIKFIRIFSFIFVFILAVYSQDLSSQSDSESKQSLINMISPNLPGNLSGSAFTVSVDENEYVVDAGDVFLIKIDVAGPAINIFQTSITPDGMIFLPKSNSFRIEGLKLVEAKLKILNALQKANPNSEVEVHLFQTHPITVTVLGAVRKEGKQQLTSSSRLFDVIQLRNETEFSVPIKKQNQFQENAALFIPNKNLRSDLYEDTLNYNFEDKISLRNIELIRDNKKIKYDLFRFKMLGDKTQNPYLMNDDVIMIPYRDKEKNVIEVQGAVGNPITFEYAENDDLSRALAFAGELLPSADSSKINIFRFMDDGKNYDEIVIDHKNNLNYSLMPDDRVFVRFKPDYHQKYSVEIVGEVKFPGKYPIIDGETTLREILALCGGFKPDASLISSKIVRRKINPNENDLERLSLMRANEMTALERSYFQQRSREDIRVVRADFNSIFENNNEQDIRLRDKDIVFIPKKLNVVFVSGGVANPGNIDYDSLKAIKDYVNDAGGFIHRANKGKVKIIKAKTGNWVDIELNDKPMPGDMIFVPMKWDRDTWSYFREGLTVAAQLGAVVAVIYSISK
jgi:polysaccharide export outer membrane protein